MAAKDQWPPPRNSVPPRCKDRKSTRLNSSHPTISYAVFCLKKKNIITVPNYVFQIAMFAMVGGGLHTMSGTTAHRRRLSRISGAPARHSRVGQHFFLMIRRPPKPPLFPCPPLFR